MNERGETAGARGRGRRRSRGGRRPAWRGAVDAALAVALVYMGLEIAGSASRAAETDARLEIVCSEAHRLYAAFADYHERNQGYPGAYAAAVFDVATLDPLRRRGYYRGPLLVNLRDGRVDAYDSPDDRGPNREFWVEMTLERDPTIRVLVARSDDAPLGGGTWREGVYLWRNGTLEQI